MDTFMRFMGAYGSTSGKAKKLREELKDYTSEQMKQWMFKNFKLDDIVELCAYLILDELNEETNEFKPITITQEEFEKHFRIRKPQLNPMRSKTEYNKSVENKLENED